MTTFFKAIPKLFVALTMALVMLTSVIPLAASAQTSTTSSATDACGGDGNFVANGPLCLPKSPFEDANSNSLLKADTATGLLATVIRLLLYFAGIIAVLMLIIGGYYYLTAAGSEEQATKGRSTIIYAIIGLVLVIFSYVIINVITKQLSAGV